MPEAPRVIPPLERLLHLKRIPLLAGLPASEVAVLADATVERLFAKGAVVFREGDPASGMHFVASGALGNYRRGVRAGVVGPGGGIGGLSVLARGAMSSRVVAEEETLTLEIDADTVEELLEDRFPVLLYLLREVNRQALALLRRHRLDPSAFFEPPPEGLDAESGFDLVDRLLLLRRVPVFERSSVTTLAELARTMANVSFEPGTVLWHEGEPSQGVLMLSSGRVEASASGGPSFHAGPGFPLGSLEAMAQVPRWYEARAATRVSALQVQVDVLVDLFEDSFEMAMDFLAAVAGATLRILEWSAARSPGEAG